jgi:hypothetical protein
MSGGAGRYRAVRGGERQTWRLSRQAKPEVILRVGRLVPINVSALSEARFRKSVKSGRGALRAFDRALAFVASVQVAEHPWGIIGCCDRAGDSARISFSTVDFEAPIYVDSEGSEPRNQFRSPYRTPLALLQETM